ncbi:MAG: HD domain-containing protein [Clostridia bacterium]
MENSFQKVAATQSNAKWSQMIKRDVELYSRNNDVRTEFARDYTRILHCCGYRRLKHKTQVFFNIDNDHVCTRIEHVAHVESVSTTIGSYLGLNVELIRAIAIGHDIGHAPFGHQGESALDKISKKHLGKPFWHEHNGLRVVDHVELLEDNKAVNRNLHLTYAVRDGIVAHCGEMDANGIIPREETIILSDAVKGKFSPYSWEACVVKISDVIAYIGRDIEDAIRLGFISNAEKGRLMVMARSYDENALNTTVIINALIQDICENSSPEKGICLGEKAFTEMKTIKSFNYDYIYKNQRFKPFKDYSDFIIVEIFNFIVKYYKGKETLDCLLKQKDIYPKMIASLTRFIVKYVSDDIIPSELRFDSKSYDNTKIYGNLSSKKDFIQAVVDYISGMTDRFAVEVFNELITFN